MPIIKITVYYLGNSLKFIKLLLYFFSIITVDKLIMYALSEQIIIPSVFQSSFMENFNIFHLIILALQQQLYCFGLLSLQ